MGSQTKELSVIELDNGQFKIFKAGDKAAAAAKSSVGKSTEVWKKFLADAWNKYCSVTAKEDRNAEAFFAELPKGARECRPEGSSSKPKVPDQTAKQPSRDEGQKQGKKEKSKRAAETPAEEEPAKKKKKKAGAAS